MTQTSPETRARVIGSSALIILGLLVAMLGAAASIQLAGGPMMLPLSQTYDDLAERAVAADPARARVLTNRALAVRPVAAEAWLRLARLDSPALSRPLGEAARLALSRSYAVGPYASGVLETRVQFAYDHWRELGQDLQSETISEVKAAWPVAQQKERLLATAGRVNDPLGALALSSLLLNLKLTEGVDPAPPRAPTGEPGGGNRRGR